MQFATASRLIALTKGIYPSSKANEKDTLDIWMGLFGRKDDGLMETALRLCWTTCQFFPTPADITTAIKELQFDESTKPSLQIAHDRKWDEPMAFKAFELVGRQKDCKKYLDNVDVTELAEYARSIFPEITDELVLKNYPELSSGQQSLHTCLACTVDKSRCITQGYRIKHVLRPDGYVSNNMSRCQKNMEQVKR